MDWFKDYQDRERRSATRLLIIGLGVVTVIVACVSVLATVTP
jgi:hypothetical protein